VNKKAKKNKIFEKLKKKIGINGAKRGGKK
jgi:hypothetical protein